jgi:hypothetical protein
MLRNTFVQLLSCPQNRMAFSNIAFQIWKYRGVPRILPPPFWEPFWFCIIIGFSVAVGLNSVTVFHNVSMWADCFLKEIHTFEGNIGNPIWICPKGHEMKSIGGFKQSPPFAWIKLQPLGRQSLTILVYSLIVINHSLLKTNSADTEAISGWTHIRWF